MRKGVKFFFNESIPIKEPALYSELLQEIVREYIRNFGSEAIFHTRGVSYDWTEVLNSFTDNYLKNLTYRLFTTGNNFPVEDEELLLHDSLYTIIDGETHNNPYGYIGAFLCDGILFTIPMVEDLRKNELTLLDSNTLYGTIDNFYGENSSHIKGLIESRRLIHLPPLEYLQKVLPAQFTEKFISQFKALPEVHQKAINLRFLKAKCNGFRAQTKGGYMRDVTTASGRVRIYELKVFSPTAIRVYFCIHNETVCIDSLGCKSKQSGDIANAQESIDSHFAG